MAAQLQKFLSDQELIVSIVKTDKQAFSLLYDKYANALFCVIYGITGKQIISEELLQRSFSIIWSKSADYDPK